jgi:prevent-host-death family protein
MSERVSTLEVRQRIGDLLNRVALRNDEFIIERKGKPLAALVGVERLEQMRAFARRHALELMNQQKSSKVTESRADDLAQQAKRWARGRRGKQGIAMSRKKK